MLVSAIARFNAMSQRQAAQNNIMNTYMTMGSMMRNINSGAFGGEQNLAMLQAMDNRLEMDLENNKMMQLFYSLWEKSLKQQQRQEIKEFFGNSNSNDGLNVIA